MSRRSRYQSWGRYPMVAQSARQLEWRSDRAPISSDHSERFIPFGNGRSYGDVCLNADGAVVDCRRLDRFVSFDSATGVLRSEAGALLSEVLELVVPRGWFLPVTPGTQFATLGGAVANDVHGKNHQSAGTFGRSVRCLELMRSTGETLLCSRQLNKDYFRATIGGLGLTGVITWVELQLRPIESSYVDQEVVRYDNLDAFFELSEEADQQFEYTVAWLDCLAKGAKLGRGLFTRGNHATQVDREQSQGPPRSGLSFPIDPPVTLVNSFTLKMFNALYYHKQRSDLVSRSVHYRPFFYPLDALLHWNRMYGAKGFFQYQCAIPSEHMKDGIREILERISKARMGSFLVVLKLFGDQTSPGLLSFPMPGATLALDFPNQGSKTLALLQQLDRVTQGCGGRVYPCKDARMSAEAFQLAYPDWRTVEKFRDPQISSSFWRRVTESA